MKMYNEKGTIKVYNGEKFKTVSYMNQEGVITFTTSQKSNKYNEFIKNNKLIALENGVEVEYTCTIIEDTEEVDKIFSHLKTTKVIPFFIPRKNKIVVRYNINDK